MNRLYLLACAVVVACAIPVGAQEADSAPSDYQIGAGDMIRIDAYGNDEISGEFLVETTGNIAFPLLGAVHVQGRTASEVSKHLEQMLEKDYYVDVQLQVEVAGFQSQPVTLLGEVGRPGTYYLRGRTTITQLLADAGGLTAGCGPTLELRREEVVDGQVVPRVMTFSTVKLRTGEDGRDVEVQAGDVVSVSAKALYFITGEVVRPGTVRDLSGHDPDAGPLPGRRPEQVRIADGGASPRDRRHQGDHDLRSGPYPQGQKWPIPAWNAGDVLIVRRRFF